MHLPVPPEVPVQAVAVSCTHEDGVQTVSLEQLPAAIRLDLKQRAPDLSPADGAFQATDVGDGPRTRFVAAARLKGRYVVAYEHGGRGYHVDLLTYDLGYAEPTPRARLTSFTRPSCVALDAALAAPLPDRPYFGPYW